MAEKVQVNKLKKVKWSRKIRSRNESGRKLVDSREKERNEKE